MRPALAALLLSSTLAPHLRADDAADAKAVVEKALTATGRKATDKDLAQTWKDKGTLSALGVKMTYTADWAFQSPDQYRFALKGEFGGAALTLLVVVSGEKAWESDGQKARPVTGEKLDYVRGEAYQMWVTSLAPLVTEKGFTLATAKGKDVGGKPTAGVKVTRDKKPAVTLYFDKESGLLVKSETTVKDEFQQWKEVLDEAFYEDYKEVGGRKVFTKLRVVRDGKPLIESALSDQQTSEKLDPKLFEPLK
ncbi:MAG: hypothetical protein K2V38_08805 [Gemmataceae bacterium]|nr:hypothetical protein [Gemmataceae bacterium]